jgi:hypothetical protein
MSESIDICLPGIESREKRADTSATRSEPLVRRRNKLEKESQLYGAMDGAMKFVKGDAIAGLIIIDRSTSACRASSRGRSGPTPRRPAPNPW